jgi:APA family basic amino acid/polyamine antiporter
MRKHRHYTLKRELGLWQTMLCGVGIILGAGIYALIGEAAGIAGNALWISFIIAAIISAFTGLSYAELSSMFPKAGAEYEYVRKTFKKNISFLTGWMIIFSGAVAAAAVSLGFGGYFTALFGTPVLVTAIIAILVMAAINFYGIKQSAIVAIILTLIEAGGLIFIIFLGLPYIGSVNYFDFPFNATADVMFSGIVAAAALIFFAYIGFEDMVKLSEETKKPTKNVPKALILAIVITTIIYILVAVSAVSVLGWEKLSTSKAPLASVASVALGENAFIILAIAALFSTFNTALLLMIATSRIVYGMAEENALPSVLSYVHPKRRTPWFAIAITTILCIVFVLFENIKTVASVTNFFVFLTFAIINLCVIKLRYKYPKAKRGFTIPINIGKLPILPILGIIFSLLLMVSLELYAILYGILILIIGLIMYETYKTAKMW